MRIRRRLSPSLCVLWALVALPAAAQQPTPPVTRTAAELAGREADLLPDEPVVTQHTARIGGATVAYTAEAGWLPIRRDGKTVAKMFYVAYTRNGVQDLGRRPLLFSFNGGPGTASVWMHMGYTGPRRVVYDDEGFAPIPPGRLEDNPYSVLDVADIVYIDPVPTGFSRMMEGEDLHMFHGTIPDVESVAELIRLYVVREGRWASPKFVIGESYGTTRGAALAGYLVERHQLYLNGVILVSMTDLGIESGPDVGFATALPQLAATAWYHRQLPPELQARPLRDVLYEVEAFALDDYLAALVQGDRLDDARRSATADRVARYTGLTAEYVLSTNLGIDTRRFWKELLRDQRLTVGRLDSRYLGIDRDAAGENPEYRRRLPDHHPCRRDRSGPLFAARPSPPGFQARSPLRPARQRPRRSPRGNEARDSGPRCCKTVSLWPGRGCHKRRSRTARCGFRAECGDSRHRGQAQAVWDTAMHRCG